MATVWAAVDWSTCKAWFDDCGLTIGKLSGRYRADIGEVRRCTFSLFRLPSDARLAMFY